MFINPYLLDHGWSHITSHKFDDVAFGQGVARNMAPTLVTPRQRKAILVEAELLLARNLLEQVFFIIPDMILELCESLFHLDIHIIDYAIELVDTQSDI